MKFFKKLIPLKIKRFVRKRMDSSFPHIILLPTLRCNYNCPYCVLKGGEFQKRYVASGQIGWGEWAEALCALDPSIITISGGEPLLFPDIEDLIVALRRRHRVSLVTNLSQRIDRFVDMVKPPLPVTVSFHPYCADVEEVSEKIRFLVRKGYSTGVNIVAYPDIISKIPEWHEHFTRKVGVGFHIDAFLNSPHPYIYQDADLEPIRHLIGSDRAFFTAESAPSLKHCRAGERHFIFFPDGEGYACFAGYYHDPESFSLGNIIKGTFSPLREARSCRLSCVEGCDLDNAGIETIEETGKSDEKD
jgi:hypothetical protein